MAAAAAAVVGAENVDTDPMPNMAARISRYAAGEARVLRLARRGARSRHPNLHNPHYDFNDDALPIGASYWVTLVSQQLRT